MRALMGNSETGRNRRLYDACNCSDGVVWCARVPDGRRLVAQTTTTSETKKFQVISVDGNQLVVKLPEGTRELTVPDDFRFNVDGKCCRCTN